MADPTSLRRLSAGKRLDPSQIDAIPSDWATVPYVVTIEAHPDLPAVPILVFRTFESVGVAPPGFAYLYATAIDGTGATVIATHDDGTPMLVLAPTT